jgi:hypothetical protein
VLCVSDADGGNDGEPQPDDHANEDGEDADAA